MPFFVISCNVFAASYTNPKGILFGIITDQRKSRAFEYFKEHLAHRRHTENSAIDSGLHLPLPGNHREASMNKGLVAVHCYALLDWNV
jgi:hypothetical protein